MADLCICTSSSPLLFVPSPSLGSLTLLPVVQHHQVQLSVVPHEALSCICRCSVAVTSPVYLHGIVLTHKSQAFCLKAHTGIHLIQTSTSDWVIPTALQLDVYTCAIAGPSRLQRLMMMMTVCSWVCNSYHIPFPFPSLIVPKATCSRDSIWRPWLRCTLLDPARIAKKPLGWRFHPPHPHVWCWWITVVPLLFCW